MKFSSQVFAVSGVLLLGIIFGWGFYFYPCTKFIPLQYKLGSGKLIEAPELMDDEYTTGIIAVLSYYRKQFRTDREGNVFITWHLASNKELILNYSTKAKNKNIVLTIKKEMRIGE